MKLFKGVHGQIFGFVISAILAIAAIVLIWIFHEKIFSFLGGTLLNALKCFIFELPGINLITTSC